MSYDVEGALITRVIEEADIRSVVRSKVTPVFFMDEGHKEVYQWLIKKYQSRGRVPSLKLVQREFPDFEPIETEDDLLTLVDEVKQGKLYADLAVAIKQITDQTREDPSSGFDELRKLAGELSITHAATGDMDVTQTADEVKAEYEQAKDGSGMMGVPYPWEYMNQVTLGMHKGELIAFYARPKALKTWLSLYVANHLHETMGVVPCYFSCEMPLNQVRRRLAALRAKLPYSAFRSGKLNEEEEHRLEASLENMVTCPPFIMSRVSGLGSAAIMEIRAKCEEYDADIAIIDGAYFMMEDETWKSFRTISRGLKSMASGLDIPVLMTTQANRSGEKPSAMRGQSTGDVAFGDSLAQDCDQLIRIIRDPQHKEMKEILLTMPALREAEGGTFVINALPAYDFSQKHVYDEEESEQALSDSDDGGIV